MRKINYVKDIVDNYTTEEVVAFLDKGISACIDQMDRALASQNLAEFGNVAATLGQVWLITKELNRKLNGEKPMEVL